MVSRLLNRRNRIRLVLLAVLAMLCQQVAFAAYVCPVTAMPAVDTAMSAGCNAMPVAKHATANTGTAQHCLLHCAQPNVVTGNAQLPTVPPLLLPAILPAQLLVVTLPVSRAAHALTAAQHAPPLAPPLRHRVLLI